MRIVDDPAGAARIAAAARDLHDDVSDAVTDDARRFAPVDTGELRDSVERVEVSPVLHQVWARAPHAMDVEFGTRPHVIEPDTKQALAWPGGAHPVRRVNHPGTPAQSYLRKALYRKRGAR